MEVVLTPVAGHGSEDTAWVCGSNSCRVRAKGPALYRDDPPQPSEPLPNIPPIYHATRE